MENVILQQTKQSDHCEIVHIFKASHLYFTANISSVIFNV